MQEFRVAPIILLAHDRIKSLLAKSEELKYRVYFTMRAHNA